ncbi:MAG TPA: hypothetical protein PK228_02970 [Saprospiraceae bacterium]|nr:hypothetical protein [Saprospiraceae bacterium]
MASEPAYLAPTDNQDLSADLGVSKPFWERSPRKFWNAHEGLIKMRIQEWQSADPAVSLAKVISKYIDGLPPDIPADVLLKITKMLIEAWEKHRNAQTVGV